MILCHHKNAKGGRLISSSLSFCRITWSRFIKFKNIWVGSQSYPTTARLKHQNEWPSFHIGSKKQIEASIGQGVPVLDEELVELLPHKWKALHPEAIWQNCVTRYRTTTAYRYKRLQRLSTPTWSDSRCNFIMQVLVPVVYRMLTFPWHEKLYRWKADLATCSSCWYSFMSWSCSCTPWMFMSMDWSWS